MNLKPARLWIWYTDLFGKHHKPQGKIFQMDKKWGYLADMDKDTFWVSFNAYSIADQVLEAFSKIKIRPQIIYRIKSQNQLLYATPSLFKKKGIKRNFGGHEQWILCLPYWKMKQGDINDPKDLPDMDLDKWIQGDQRIVFEEGGFRYA